jgi:electron transport complex protein RnfG
MNKIAYFIKQSWLLLIASFIFGLLIAVTNAALQPKIQFNKQQKLNNLMQGLIPAAVDFKKASKKVEFEPNKKMASTDIYAAIDDANNTIGYAFIAQGAGFSDKITLVVAVDNNFEKIFGYKVLTSNETPGFGDKINNDFFANQFKNAPVKNLELSKVGDPKKINAQIVAITGATVSSTAVVNMINNYLIPIKEKFTKKELF